MKRGLFLCVLLSLTIGKATAQSRAGGYTFTAWAPTQWSVIEYRIKCEGGSVPGSESGPISWRVEYRNRSKQQPVSFDYVILAPRGNAPAAKSGRVTIKGGGMASILATVNTDRCDEGVSARLGKVRVGVDADSVPYRPADRGD
jgi:hypothetical protein